jgi:hypothetical protein
MTFILRNSRWGSIDKLLEFVNAGFDVGGRHLGGLYERRKRNGTVTEDAKISSNLLPLVQSGRIYTAKGVVPGRLGLTGR